MSVRLVIDNGRGSASVFLTPSEANLAYLEQLSEDLRATAESLVRESVDLLLGARADRLPFAKAKVEQALVKSQEADLVADEVERLEQSLPRTRRMEESVPYTEGSTT